MSRPLPSNELTVAILAGFVSAGLFLLFAGLGLGFFFMFLPSIPLFAAGLRANARVTLAASIIGAAVILALTSLPITLVYVVFLALPCWHFTRKSLLSRFDSEGNLQWYPIGAILTELTCYACLAILGLTLYYYGEEGGLPALLSVNITQAFSDLSAQYGEVVQKLAGDWSFLVFSITTWLWAMALYGHGWFTNRMLAHRDQNVRPDFAVTLFELPNWLFSALALAALASLIGGPSLRFLGNSTLISLMLPYFFCGAAWLHQISHEWPNRRFFLFFVYFAVFTQFWPALIVAFLGLRWHIKRLSATGTSSRS